MLSDLLLRGAPDFWFLAGQHFRERGQLDARWRNQNQAEVFRLRSGGPELREIVVEDLRIPDSLLQSLVLDKGRLAGDRQMNHLGADLVEQLDIGILANLTGLGRIAPGRDPHALTLERGMPNPNFGLVANSGRQIRPSRLGS